MDAGLTLQGLIDRARACGCATRQCDTFGQTDTIVSSPAATVRFYASGLILRNDEKMFCRIRSVKQAADLLGLGDDQPMAKLAEPPPSKPPPQEPTDQMQQPEPKPPQTKRDARRNEDRPCR